MFYHHTPRIEASAPRGAREKAIHIRRAARGESAVQRLAALDERPVPRGDLLVAEHDGRAVAAIGIESGHSVADPFTRTRDTLALLRLRARQIGQDRKAA